MNRINPIKLLRSAAYLKITVLFLAAFMIAGCVVWSQNPTNYSENEVINVLMKTSMGDMEIQLYPQQAPITVANFLRYVDAGAYRGGEFYRVVREDNDRGSPKITVIQGGASKSFTEFDPIEFESTAQTGIKHLDGTLSMARLEPNSATHEFFICVGNQPALDFGAKRHSDGLGFAAFGRVIKGMEVAHKINQIRATQSSDDAYLEGQILQQPVIIEQIIRQ